MIVFNVNLKIFNLVYESLETRGVDLKKGPLDEIVDIFPKIVLVNFLESILEMLNSRSFEVYMFCARVKEHN